MLIFKYKWVTSLYVAMSILYVVLVLITKPDIYLTSAFHLGLEQARTLSIVVGIPFIVVWTMALWAYAGMQSYADTIQGSDEAEAYTRMARSILYTVFFLPVASLLNECTTYIQHIRPSFGVSLALFANLIIVGIGLAAFVYAYSGSVELLRLIHIRPQVDQLLSGTLFVFFMALYVILVVHQPGEQQIPTYSILTFPNYESSVLSDIVILFPRLVGWFIGFLSVRNIYTFSTKVQGFFYRRAFRSVARGMLAVVLAALIFRVTQDIPVQSHNASVTMLILLSYVVLVVFGVGFSLLCIGSSNLHKIERIDG